MSAEISGCSSTTHAMRCPKCYNYGYMLISHVDPTLQHLIL